MNPEGAKRTQKKTTKTQKKIGRLSNTWKKDIAFNGT